MNHFLRFTYKFPLLIFLLLISAVPAMAQHNISGKVVDLSGLPIKGVSVYLDNTIDGATTDSAGEFHFTTSETGNQTIMATDVSHPAAGQPIVIVGDVTGITITMKTGTKELKSVTITAGSFDASNDRSTTTLKPLDILTTAGANADVVKAMETLPGVQQTGTENGLFVRGGDASEAAILLDEMVVQNAFFSGPPGVTTRSRFGPFSFQGVSFSSGGYSARYGQALSGVLELTSTDLPEKSNANVGISSGAVYASATKKWKNSSLDVGGTYLNLAPFYSLATTNVKFYDPPTGGTANARYVWKPNKKGIFKASFNTNYTTSGIAIPNPYAGIKDTGSNAYNPFVGQPDTINFLTRDTYYYTNVSYKQSFKKKFSLYTAASYSYDLTNNKFGGIPIKETDQRSQFRVEIKDYITTRLDLLVGTDVQNFSIAKSFDTFSAYKQSFIETQPASYAELNWTPLYWLSIRPGVRYEYSALLKADDVAPRLAAAITTGDYSQVSLAYGIFYQDPGYNYLLANYRPGMQQAIHYIANWQWSKHDRTLRVEGYYKNYANLVHEINNGNYYDPNPYRLITDTLQVNNSGYGYAEGFELFWRDKKTVHNLDYWVSYSYIDTRRLYSNFLYEATPSFIANHNLNLVTKYFVDKWHMNFSATYTFASGYPYFNPEKPLNSSTFLSDHTPDFNNLGVSIAWLHSFGSWFSVFYISVDNITNSHNIFGYRYNYNSNNVAVGAPSPIVPALYRSIFFGVNMSLTQFKKDEL